MVYTDYQSDIVQLVQKIEHTRPLVLNISNYVIMNITANALLAFGASPMMSIEKSEIGELAQMSHAACRCLRSCATLDAMKSFALALLLSTLGRRQ